MIAIEAKCHHNYLCSLYNRARQANDGDYSFLHGIAFAELVANLEDNHSYENSGPIFNLIYIAQLYKNRLEQLGMAVEIHTTRLKNRLLSALPRVRDTLLSVENLLSWQ